MAVVVLRSVFRGLTRRKSPMRKILTHTLSALIVVLCLSMLAECRVLNVPDEFESIGAAIDAASSPQSPNLADTVVCLPRLYHENLLIRKNVVLIGMFALNNDSLDLRETVIEGDLHSPVIRIVGRISPTIAGMSIRQGGGSEGGGVTIQNGASPRIRSNIISNNESGVLFTGGSSGAVQDCRIIDNESRFGGDGIVCRNASPTLRRNLISNNSGHGIFCFESSNTAIISNQIICNGSTGLKLWSSVLTIEDCAVEFNHDNSVGGVMLVNGSNVLMVDCVIRENVGGDFGGLYCFDSNPEFLDCVIDQNVGESVGGVKCVGNSMPLFEDCEITNNEGRRGFGAIRFEGCSPILENCTISGNSSRSGCGGISLSHSSASIEFCDIFDQLSRGNGGALDLYYSTVIMNKCTIVGNRSTALGGAFNIAGGCYVDISNSIIWGNSTPSMNLINWGETPETQVSLNVDYTDMDFIEAEVPSQGVAEVNWDKSNMNLDPLFIDEAQHNFHLLEDSPCIDRGNPRAGFDRDSTVIDLGSSFFPQANLILSTNWISFLGVYINDSASRILELRNNGLSPLEISSIAINGSDYLTIALPGNNESHTLQPHTSLRCEVKYSPLRSGTHRGVVSILSEDRGSPRMVVYINCRAMGVGTQGLAPAEFGISGVVPNPFNSSFKLELNLPTPGSVAVSIFDIQGRAVGDAQRFVGKAGMNVFDIDGSQMPTGEYFLLARWQDQERMVKVISLK